MPESLTEERDSALAERDSARGERDNARIERDGLRSQASRSEKNKVAQEQFIATLSHDLRNPIGAIKMAVEILRDGLPTGELLEMVDLIDRNAEQAGDLINRLLDAHLIKSGAKLPLQIEHCDLLAVISKCEDMLAPQELSRVEQPSNSGKIMGYWDPNALARAIKNLFSNALKFGDYDKPISVKIWQGPDIVKVLVQSFGEVISLENQVRIFDSYFRVRSNGAKSNRGWGLGLTLVKGIAEAHNGLVKVSSSISEGTTLTLPYDSRSN